MTFCSLSNHFKNLTSRNKKNPSPFRRNLYAASRKLLAALLLISVILNIIPPTPVEAAAALTITQITWDIVGLDSNKVTIGPNNFPIGVRVCNTGGTAATNITSSFVWDAGGTDSGTYINLRPGSLTTYDSNKVASLAAGSCHDFYYEVQITRDAGAYDQTRRYHITASADGISAISTPTPREIFVEYLVSQNRNAVTNIQYKLASDSIYTDVANGGTLNLSVGNTYDIKLIGKTSTNGYNQLESFINFPNTIFRVNSVSSSYTAGVSPTDKLYADACGWDNNPLSPSYRSCIVSDNKNGGDVINTYNITIIGGGGSTETLNTLLYDFSGSSYHYNADFSSSARYISIASSISIAKSFSPISISAGSSSTLNIALTNSSSTALSNVTFSDSLPSSPAQMTVASTPNVTTSVGCTSPSVTATGGTTSISYSGGVAASSTCTISVDISVPASPTSGTYTNTIYDLAVNSVSTGEIATASLTVEEAPAGGSCTTVTIANWTISGSTAPPTVTTTDSGATALAYSNGVNDNDGTYWRITDSTSGSGDPIDLTTDKYFRFQISTALYTDVKMSFSYDAGNQGADNFDVYYGNSSTISPPGNPVALAGAQYVPTTTLQTVTDLDFTGKTNTSGDTYFFLYSYNAGNQGTNNWIGINDITFTGCRPSQTIQKAFSPNPITAGGTSTLTFTLKNYDSPDATSASFTDPLPSGVKIASTPNVSNTCSGTVTAVADSSVISLSGGTIPGKGAGEFGSCTISIDVTASSAGSYDNVSGYLSANGSTINVQATDTLTVYDAPIFSKNFSTDPIYNSSSGASPTVSTLTFTLTNPNSADLLSAAFTDNLPTNLVVATTPNLSNTCLGTATATAGSSTISLSGGTVTANSSCTISVDASSGTSASYNNDAGKLTGTVSGTSVSSENALDSLTIVDINPSISLLKQVSTNPSGPWSSNLVVGPSSNVYYLLTVENTGDVPLTFLSVTDPDVSTVSCTWPETLPVASADQDPTASCVLGPITSETSGSHSNTATAQGTYNSSNYNDTSTATYSISDLILSKSAAESFFSAAGDTLNYSYLVTNNGASALAGPVTVSDNLAVVSCPNVNTVGNNDSNLDPGESITCTAAYTVTSSDMTAGSVTNVASATVDSVTTNYARETVYRNLPDLTVTKSNDQSGFSPKGSIYTWSITVNNEGPVAATFSSGQKILNDPLPSGPTYGATPTISNQIGITGTIDCAINTGVLSCTASGGAVIISASTGSFTVSITSTPATEGNLENIVTVDPDGNIAESSEGNNAHSDSITILASTPPSLGIAKDNSSATVTAGGTTTYVLTISNTGGTATSGTITIVDVLPSGLSVSDGSLTLGGAQSADWSCSATSNVITCTSSTAIAATSGTSVFSFTVNVDSDASGTLLNKTQVGGGNDPDTSTPTSASAGNCTGTDTPTKGCATDSDSVIKPSLGLSKSNGTAIVIPGNTTTYTLTVSNTGSAPTSGTITSVDVLPGGLSVSDGSLTLGGVDAGNWSCTAATDVITCTSSTAIAATSGTSVFSFTVDVDSDASGTQLNKAQVGGGSDPDTSTPNSTSAGNCTGADTPTKGCATDSDNAISQSISGNVFQDSNSNSTKNSGETTISNVTIKLYTDPNGDGDPSDGTLVSTKVTDANGNYQFNNLSTGTYLIVETDPSGYVSTTPNNVSVSLASGENKTIDFGDIQIPSGSGLASISGIVIEDQNGNGIQDSGEPPLPNVTVKLYSTDGSEIDSVTTNASGAYNFSGLQPGTYNVVESDPGGYVSSSLNQVGVTISGGQNANVDYLDFINPGGTIIDPAVTKFGAPDQAEVGDTVIYTITVGNNGNDNATNVVLTDTKPDFIDFIAVEIYPDPGPVTIPRSYSGNTLTIDFGTLTPADLYTIIVTSIVNSSGRPPGGTNQVALTFDAATGNLVPNDNSSVVSTIIASSPPEEDDVTVLPSTGFIPGKSTQLPMQSSDKHYENLGSIWIEIPKLKIKQPIIGVPLIDGQYDVTWLGEQVGWLNNSAFPTWNGNSVLSGHIYDALGKSGVFRWLTLLKFNDEIIIHLYGQEYTYQVRTVEKYISPNNVEKVFESEELSWITLLTCQGYDAQSDTYDWRTIVKAIQISVEGE